MPPVCPNCITYDSLTTMITDGVADGRIECENCGWVGESDDLDQKDD